MSRKPYRVLLSRAHTLDIALPALREAARQLQQLERERVTVDQEIAELLVSMDAHEPGNGGWGHRFNWLLMELTRQMKDGNDLDPSEHDHVGTNLAQCERCGLAAEIHRSGVSGRVHVGLGS